MSRYFSGRGVDLGHVHALPAQSFEALCLNHLLTTIVLPVTRAQFHALSAKERGQAKRVDYLVPATFAEESSKRVTELAQACNLIALDVDDSGQAKRLITGGWEGLNGLGVAVWHTASSTPQAPRLRVLVSAEAIPVARYGDAVRTVAEMLGLADVTRESLVPVQPMFLPTGFMGDADSPVIHCNSTGDAFTTLDILAEEDAVIAPEEKPNANRSPDAVEDITYLRTPMEHITLEDAESALEQLDPDCSMQEWIEVGAGLKHQFGEEGYKLWDTWSAKGKKYVDDDETEYRWGTLKANPIDREPVTIRSVFRLASARGWTNKALVHRTFTLVSEWLKSPSRSTEELFDQGTQRIAKAGPAIGQFERKALITTLKETLTAREIGVTLPDIRKEVRRLEMQAAKSGGTPAWAKGLCYVTSLNLFYRHTTDRKFAPEVIDLMHTAPAIGEDAPMRPRDYLIQVVNVQTVENLRYDPARGEKRFFTEDDKPYVNTYRPTYAPANPTRAKEAGAIFQAHIRNLVREEEYQRVLIDFLAYQVQCPGKKIRWATLLQSTQGAGKTFLAVAMTAVLGRRNVKKLTASNVMDGQYNDWAYGSQLVVMEEVRIIGSNRYGVMDKLKPCISDDEISLTKKFEHHQTVPNITNYLMFTNHHDSLAIHDDDRRYFVLASPLQRPEDLTPLGGAAYFDRLFGMLRDNPGGLRAWLEQWEISDAFKPEGRAPLTPYLYQLAENAATPLAAAVKNTLEDAPHPLVGGDLVSLRCLRACLDTEHVPAFTDQALALVLREQGWVKYDRMMLEGEMHQLWYRNGLKDIRRKAERRLKYL